MIWQGGPNTIQINANAHTLEADNVVMCEDQWEWNTCK